jgi:hypothetical protein
MGWEDRSPSSRGRRELGEHLRNSALKAVHLVLGGDDGFHPCIHRHLSARRIKLASHYTG